MAYLPTGGGGAYKKVAKIASFAFNSATSLSIFAYTASNATDSPN